MFRFVLGFELSWTSLFTVLMRPTAELQQIKGLTGPPPGKGSSKAGHYRTMIQVALALSNQRERGPMIWKHYENTCWLFMVIHRFHLPHSLACSYRVVPRFVEIRDGPELVTGYQLITHRTEGANSLLRGLDARHFC